MPDAPPPAPAPSPAPPTAPALTEDQTSGRMFVRWNLVTLIIGIIALVVGWLALGKAEGAPGAEGVLPLAADELWDDGQAEVARYDARRTIYGAERAYELVRVVVKEPFDPRQGVKPDADRPGVVDAFKVVAAHEVPTGKAYEYRQTTFTHVARRDPRRLLSLTMSSQEWCGNTYVRLHHDGEGLRRVAHSYWDGQGDWSDTLPAGTWAEDQLPFTLRALDPARAPLEVSLLPTTLGNKAPRDVRPVTARLEVGAPDEEVVTPAGAFRCVRWEVRAGERVARYWVSSSGARPLVRYEDGTGAATLTRLERSAYWLAGR